MYIVMRNFYSGELVTAGPYENSMEPTLNPAWKEYISVYYCDTREGAEEFMCTQVARISDMNPTQYRVFISQANVEWGNREEYSKCLDY